MVVDVFHKLARSFDVWELHQMECLGANELSKKKLKEPISKDLVLLFMIITKEDGIHHSTKHSNLNQHANGIMDKLFALDLLVEVVFLNFCL
jgi:hypothetical protein